MKKRGRPEKNGVVPVWMGLRAFHILWAFHEARKEGQKYEIALAQTVEVIRNEFPQMPMSITEAKRVLAELQPEGVENVFSISRTDNSKWEIGLALRPVYRRAISKTTSER